jgi:hydrogenase maturation protease
MNERTPAADRPRAAAPAGDPVRAIADAVLYEGYVLWPYRRSALKNAQRWTFGGVYPRAHSAGRGPGDDPCAMQTQCLLEATGEARLSVDVRFLHVVHRQAVDRDGRPLDALAGDAPGERHLTWDEAVERELSLPPTPLCELAVGERLELSIPAGRTEERHAAGALVRSWEALTGRVVLHAEQLEPALHVLTVRIENDTPWRGGPREQLMRHTLCSTHTELDVEGGAFVSLTDPPEWLADAAAACENAGTWPVLVGEDGARDRLLSSPIVLADYPRVAPESPGDLFDGGEIDQLLILNLLALTDAEKDEARASDPRVRELLARSEALTPQQLLRLHGTVRR